MARRKLNEEVKRVHLWLYEKDLQRLAVFFPDLEQSEAVRRIVRTVLNGIEARALESATHISINPEDLNVQSLE